MLGIDNRTNFPAALVPVWTVQGHEAVLVIVKATYHIGDAQLEDKDEQVPVLHADIYRGEPGVSSVVLESDLALFKARADVVINATAYAPRGRPERGLTVSARVGSAQRTLLVWGDRRWVRGVVGWNATRPRPFTEMPIVYERAFGGSASMDDITGEGRFFHANPVGCGFHVSRSTVSESPLPNIELPDQRITGWSDRPRPAGLGVVDRWWHPRAAYAGTYDEAWRRERLPYLPTDFDTRFFQCASEGMSIDYPAGGEPVVLTNLSRSGVLAFPLVVPDITLLVKQARGRSEARPVVDTVVIEPDRQRVILTMRTLLLCEGNVFSVREVMIAHASPHIRRAFLAGKRILHRGRLRP